MPTYNNKTVVLHELRGLDAEVTNCSDPSQIGIRGTVLDETKNTLLIGTPTGARKIVKKTATFKFRRSGKVFLVEGEEINFRGYERIEKSMRFYKKRKL